MTWLPHLYVIIVVNKQHLSIDCTFNTFTRNVYKKRYELLELNNIDLTKYKLISIKVF